MIKESKSFFFASFILFLFFGAALFAPWITSYDPISMDLSSRLQAPSLQHYFRTDQNGVDVFSQILFGARTSLLIALSVTFISLLIGLLMGSLSGYWGGLWDTVVMRIVDTLYAFPGFLLILTLAAVLQSTSLWSVIFVLSITGWTSFARLIRAEILHLKQREFVLGAESMGASHWRKLVFHIWPGLIGPVSVQASFAMAAVVITESSLSFLGIGLPPGTPSWGALLNSGRNYLIEAPQLSLFPGFALLLLILSFNILGDALRDMLDPKA